MAWRNQGITGSNNIPLGKRRFAGDADEDGVANGVGNGVGNGTAPATGFSNGDRDVMRGRSPERTFCFFPPSPSPSPFPLRLS
jgi:splicing factor 1